MISLFYSELSRTSVCTIIALFNKHHVLSAQGSTLEILITISYFTLTTIVDSHAHQGARWNVSSHMTSLHLTQHPRQLDYHILFGPYHNHWFSRWPGGALKRFITSHIFTSNARWASPHIWIVSSPVTLNYHMMLHTFHDRWFSRSPRSAPNSFIIVPLHPSNGHFGFGHVGFHAWLKSGHLRLAISDFILDSHPNFHRTTYRSFLPTKGFGSYIHQASRP